MNMNKKHLAAAAPLFAALVAYGVHSAPQPKQSLASGINEAMTHPHSMMQELRDEHTGVQPYEFVYQLEDSEDTQ